MTAALASERVEHFHEPYTRDEDMIVAERRFRGDSAKSVAREIGRTPSSVNNRFRALRRRMESEFGPVLRKHRQEELALMRKLLAEERLPDVGELP